MKTIFKTNNIKLEQYGKELSKHLESVDLFFFFYKYISKKEQRGATKST
jgi:hypothetical protein